MAMEEWDVRRKDFINVLHHHPPLMRKLETWPIQLMPHQKGPPQSVQYHPIYQAQGDT